MSFQGFYTTKGLALAAKMAAGTKLTITKVTAGSGVTVKDAPALAGEKQTLTAGTAAVSGATAVLPVTLAEAGVSAAYSLTELGVYAQDPNAGEILFQVFRMDTPVPLTASGENAYRFYLKQTMGAAGITVTCSPAGLLIDEDLEPVRTALAKKPDAALARIDLSVSKSGSDTSGDGSEDHPFLTIQKALDSLPKILLGQVVIRVSAGTYAENVSISRFSGAGGLLIRNLNDETVKVKYMEALSVDLAGGLELSGLELTGTSDDKYKPSLRVSGCARVRVSYVTCTGAAADAIYGALRFEHTRLAEVTNTVISNKPIALDVLASTVYLSDTVTGTGNTVGIRCGSAWGSHGGYAQKGGAALGGEEEKGFGGQIW